MIRYLAIKNLAVIESAAVEFERSFNVLTGETGAGKSMLVEAVGLLLGGRASSDLVRTGEDSASIEAQLETPDGRDVVVRREITALGRSRAFVDGQLVNAAALRALVSELVELHGQHEHQALLDPATHLPMLDTWAHLGAQASAVAAAWIGVSEAAQSLARAELDAGERASRLELVEFHLAELRKAAITEGEDEALERTRDVLRHAGRLQALCAEAYSLLYDHETAALGTLAQVWKRISELSAIDDTFAPHAAARDAIKAQLDDLALTLRDYGERLEASPGRLQEIEDRLALLERLKRKHGPTLAEVIDRTVALERELDALTEGPQHKDAARAALDAARTAFAAVAGTLSKARHVAAQALGAAVEAGLAELGMARTRFEVRLSTTDSPQGWHAGGIDTAEFFLAANPGEDPRPLARIASGGELSRIMLAFKTLAAGEHPTRTLIFDEVDAGIGGRAASVVGEKLRSLGDRSQVLCITHLPQIAALAATHYAIDKTAKGPRTVTAVTRLDDRGRELEIARMMAGESALSSDVLMAARTLLQAKAKVTPEAKAKGESSRRAKAKVRP
ncbi:MAG: DNA repair protein RecN [Acidobacteria bacterium]|nr:DNA repair protein RecN [Acidobacteriota bacterium]